MGNPNILQENCTDVGRATLIIEVLTTVWLKGDRGKFRTVHMAVGQNQWYHFGVGAQFSGDWDVHWGYRVLTHGHMGLSRCCL